LADQENPPQGPPSTPPLPLGGGAGGGDRKDIVPINIEDEMRRSYLDYAMSVIVGRALPDIRDGLKPVHRRILFGMHEMGLAHNRPYRKCGEKDQYYGHLQQNSRYDQSADFGRVHSSRKSSHDGQKWKKSDDSGKLTQNWLINT